ncbi:MAG: permease, partial [Clostridiaceae bacterium]
TIIGKLQLEKFVESYVISNHILLLDEEKIIQKIRINSAKNQGLKIIKKVWLYVLIGVGIGAAIHNYIPESFITAVIGADKWWSVLVATLVGVPMYTDVFTTLPIAEALVASGVGLGTVLSFMMGVTALSLPSIVMLSKVVKSKLLVIFLSIVILGIILIGYLFNAFNYLFI